MTTFRFGSAETFLTYGRRFLLYWNPLPGFPPLVFLMGPTYLGLIHHGSHGAVPGGEDPPPVEEGPAAGLEEPRLVALVRLDALEKYLHRFSGLA